MSDSFPTQNGPDKSSSLCLLRSDVSRAEMWEDARQKAVTENDLESLEMGERRGRRMSKTDIDGSEMLKIERLSAWTGSDSTV